MLKDRRATSPASRIVHGRRWVLSLARRGEGVEAGVQLVDMELNGKEGVYSVLPRAPGAA